MPGIRFESNPATREINGPRRFGGIAPIKESALANLGDDMTSTDLKQISGFLEENFEAFAEYLAKGDGPSNNHSADGERLAAGICQRLDDFQVGEFWAIALSEEE